MSRIGNYHSPFTRMIETMVIKGDKYICIKDFYSLAGDLVFTTGIIYLAITDRCITSGNYNLHVTENFFEHFKL